jgi:uncharacterized protein (TIGR02246 family)
VDESETRDLIDRFNRAWNGHDLDAALELTTDDCIFENTSPPPDGGSFRGRDQVRAAWREVFDNPRSHFETEDVFVAGDRVVQLWRYSWGDGHVRGVDVITVREGRVAAKLSYVKG